MLMSYFQRLILKLEKVSLFVYLWSAFFYAKLIGVKIGKSPVFYGMPIFRRWNNSYIKIGKNCTFRNNYSSNTVGVKQKCFFSSHGNASIDIGDDCGFSGTIISAYKKIVIGNRVLFGANVTIIDSDRHSIFYEQRLGGNETVNSKSIFIDDDVWIGMNVTILKGVSIGKGAVIAANSTVVSDVLEKSIYAGVPAKFIKKIYD